MAAVAVAVVLAAAATPLAAVVARRVGIVDHPGDLKLQRRPIPYLGGMGVLAGIAGPVGAARPSMLVPLGLAATLGLVDDAVGLPPGLRLVVEVGVGVAVAVVAPTGLGPGATLATVVGTVALINAMNMLDGLDGLAAGTAAAGVFGVSASLSGDQRTLALATGGACIGFLFHNRSPASIYLGDSGSYLLGTAAAVLVTASWHEGRSTALGIGALGAVSVPAVELITTVIRRARAHELLFSGDRSHVYDRLLALGWSVPLIAATFAAGQGLFAALGWAGGRSTVWWAAAGLSAAWLLPLAIAAAVARQADDGRTSRRRSSTG